MTKQISPLRQRMIDDMAFRNMSPNTQKVYTYAVANFARYHGSSPDKLGIEDVRDYRLHLLCPRPQGDARSIRSSAPCASSTARRSATRRWPSRFPFARTEDTLPAVLTRTRCCALEGGARSEDAHDLHHHLRGRPARLRGRHAHDRRHRQRAHGDPRAPSQGPQGSLRHAVRAAARRSCATTGSARSRPATCLFPGPNPRPPDHDALRAARLSRGGRRAGLDARSSPRTRCATASPRICWSRASIFV